MPAGWLQNYFNAIQTPNTFKTEMSYAIIQEYSQEYFQPKIGRKIRIFSLGSKKQYSYFFYMAVSYQDRISLVELNIDSGLDFPI